MKQRIVWLSVLTGLLSVPALAQLAPVSAPAAVELTVPSDVVSYRVLGALLVGATRSGKLVTYDIANRAAPVRKAELDVGAPIAELRLADGVLLAVSKDNSVRAFLFGDDGAPIALHWSGAAPASAGPAVARKGALGKVVEAKRGNLLIELEDAAGVVPGDILLVRSRAKEVKLNPFTGVEEETATNAPTAVVEVIRVEGTRAVAELNRGDVAMPGDTVELNDHRREVSRQFPARSDYTQWARATLRPMANIGAIDIASLTDLAWGYYGSWFHVQVHIAPLGISVPNGSDLFNAHAIFAYSSDFAEFGLGVGYFRETWGAYSAYDCTTGSTASLASTSVGGYVSQATSCTKSGPSFVQHLRLGAIDGLNVRVTNTTVISDGFRFGYFDASLDIPITRTLNVYGLGGGGTNIGIGEFGVRTYLRGVGGHETIVLTTGVGYTALPTSTVYGAQTQTIPGTSTQSYVNGSNQVAGPHFALGVEYRL